MELIVFLVVVLIILSYYYTIHKFEYWQKRGLPYDKPLPYIGNSLALLKLGIGPYLKEVYEKFDSPLIGTYLLGQPQLIVKDPKIINNIATEDFLNFSGRMASGNVVSDPLGSQMLSVLKYPQWRELRQKFTAAFTSGKLKLMFPLMMEIRNDLLEYVKRNDKIPIDGKDLCTRYTTDIIASCAFGVKASSFLEEDSDFRVISQKAFELTLTRIVQITCFFISPFLVNLFKMKFFNTHCTELLRNLFWEVVKKRRTTLVKRNDFVDVLMGIQETVSEDGKFKFDGDIVVAQAIQFFVGGFETSGSTATFAMYELALHLNIQNKLRNEILTVVANHNGVSYGAVQEMKYLDMVVHETLRKYPIVPFLDRRTNDNYRIPDTEFIIEKGIAVFIPIMGLHYDPKYYPEPEKFDPERFTADNKASRPSSVYLAFGHGPRNCIGARFGLLSTKVFLINVLMEYEIFKADDTPSYIEKYSRGFLLSSAAPLKFIFKKINIS